MGKTNIQWCDFTFNPWMGCTKVSPGCDHCYAEGWAKRSGLVQWGMGEPRRRTTEQYWKGPLKWCEAAVKAGRRNKVFAASLADVWDPEVPPEWRTDLFHLILDTRDGLDWLLLTKRPENIEGMLPRAIGETELWPWPNVWLGTTAEDQEHYNKRWTVLRKVPAKVRFISYEPALGQIVLDKIVEHPTYPLTDPQPYPDWIIYGGESGRHARDPDGMRGIGLAYDMRTQCEERDIAFFMKQTVGKGPIPTDLMTRQFPQ